MSGTRLQLAWQVFSDLVIATSIIWALPLVLGAATALIGLLF
jgi:hypothetical protein